MQLDESQLGQDFGPEIKSELDLSFAKIERIILESIAASDDRVAVHQALLHLVVCGNAMIYMSKDGLKVYPLNRYVVDRDGNGQVVEIITKERISKQVLKEQLPKDFFTDARGVSEEGSYDDDMDVYTHVKRDNNRFVWHQEVSDKIVKGSQGKSPLGTSPWIPLMFNKVDGESYGRGRVGQFIGDLKSLEGLSQALVEGLLLQLKLYSLSAPHLQPNPAHLLLQVTVQSFRVVLMT